MMIQETLILDSALIKPKLPRSKLYDLVLKAAMPIKIKEMLIADSKDRLKNPAMDLLSDLMLMYDAVKSINYIREIDKNADCVYKFNDDNHLLIAKKSVIEYWQSIVDLHFKLSQKIHDLSKKHDLNELYSAIRDIDVSDLDESYRLKIDALDAFK